jgi:hypothetical protein
VSDSLEKVAAETDARLARQQQRAT